ncbi:MAG: RICIN domain-containing protein [Bifidobacterium sp.]|nr:RICIN domain-containing protein [Bifidobacterium sp.]
MSGREPLLKSHGADAGKSDSRLTSNHSRTYLKDEKMKDTLVKAAVKLAAVLAAPALGLALTAVPAQAATDTNLSGFGRAGIGSTTSSPVLGSQGNGFGNNTIGNQLVSPAADDAKDTMPDNPSQKLPDKVSTAVPDDATVVSKDLAVTKDGQVKNIETGKPVTDPKVVGTPNKQPDPLAKTGGKRFIPVEASEVKQAVQKNGGDANAADNAGSGSSSNTSSGNNTGSTNANAASQLQTQTTSKPAGTVRNVSLGNGDWGAYWGSYNGTPAFFEAGGNLFAQQAKGVVDVSEHQGTIDWQAAKNAGVEGAIIRIGFGWGNRLDYQAQRNINECKRLGIPFGIYLYSYAYDNDSAWAEGIDTVNKLHGAGVSPGDLSYPVFYDLEHWSWTGHTPPTNPWVYDAMVKTWYGALGAYGYNSLSVYSYTYYLNTSLNTPDTRNNTRWVASYGARTNFPYASNDRGWQYADNGNVSGIGNVDINAFGNYNYSNSGMGQSPVPQIGNYRAANLPNGKYFISSSAKDSSGIDIAGASTANGVQLQLYSANHTVAQQYQLTRQNDGSYEIRNVASNKVFDVPAANAYPGAVVQQFDANGSKAQHWFLRDTGNGAIYIQSALGDWVLDLKDFNTSNSAKFQLTTPNFSKAQQYIFSTVSTIPQGHLRVGSLVNSNIVFDIPGASKENGAPLNLFSWNDTDAQKYDFQEVGNAIYQIWNIHSGKVIDLPAANTSNGVNLQQFDANGTCSQHWAIREFASGQYSFYSSCAADSAMDIPGAAAINSQRIQLFSGNGTNAQRWWLSPVRSGREEWNDLAAANRESLPDGTYTLNANNNRGMALDVDGGSMFDSARVQLYSVNGTGAQSWIVSHDGNGYITLTNRNSRKVLDVAGAQDASGARVQQFASNGTYAQKWIAIKDGGMTKIVSALNPNLVLDVACAAMVNGATVQIYSDNGTGAQRWIPTRR